MKGTDRESLLSEEALLSENALYEERIFLYIDHMSRYKGHHDNGAMRIQDPKCAQAPATRSRKNDTP